MDWRQQTIQNIFGGDEKKFEDAWNEAAKEGIKEAVSWDDLSRSATVLPQLENEARQYIKLFLGYIPSPAVTLKFEPFLRGLISFAKQGGMDEETFHHQVKEHIKLIRNQDLEPGACVEYSADLYKAYHSNFASHGLTVRKRLTCMLGYEPKIEHSALAELWFRSILNRNIIKPNSPINEIDYKAIALIKYREVYLEQGKQAADQSPIWDAWKISEALNLIDDNGD